MAGVVHIPWYATGFRGDQLEEQLARVSVIATRYGATSYSLHRSRDDRYKLLQLLEFDAHADFDRFWHGPEMVDMRTYCQGWFQVPVLYTWNDLVASGGLAAAHAGHPAAHAAAAPAGE